MGVLVEGAWRDGELPQETGAGGEFRRVDCRFRDRITAEVSPVPPLNPLMPLGFSIGRGATRGDTHGPRCRAERARKPALIISRATLRSASRSSMRSISDCRRCFASCWACSARCSGVTEEVN